MVDRRTALAGLAGGLTAATGAAATLPGHYVDAAILALEPRWRAAHAEYERRFAAVAIADRLAIEQPSEENDRRFEAFEAYADEALHLADAIAVEAISTPVLTMEGLLAKVRIMEGGGWLDGSLYKSNPALAMATDIKRMGGVNG